MKKSLFVLLLIQASVILSGQSKDEKAIRLILHEQTIAWNNGDVDAFMNGYWKNDSLMFIGKSGVTYGWLHTLNNYKKRYPDAASMGELTFNLIKIERLSKKYCYVTGKWHLKRTIGDLEGHFTLLFEKLNGHWLIISDHSS
jgi:ketosteroid isomerase-like protein